MTEVKIRHSEPEDVPAIRRVHAGPAAYGGTLQLPYPSVRRWRERLEELSEGSYSLVAERNGEIVGHLMLTAYQTPRRRHVGTLGMAVLDALQGQGVGDRLVAAALDMADRWLALQRLELTVYTDNEAAVGLYRKHGFEIEGEAPAYAVRDGELVAAYHMGRVRGG